MDDWPRDPEDQRRSRDDARPPRSGNLPEPPRGGNRRTPPPSHGNNPAWPTEAPQPTEHREPRTDREPRSDRQPRADRQQPNPTQRRSTQRHPSQRQLSQGQLSQGQLSQRQHTQGQSSQREPGRGTPSPGTAAPGTAAPGTATPGTAARLPRPPADSVRGRLPDTPRDPNATRRTPTDAASPSATRRTPITPPAEATRRVPTDAPADTEAPRRRMSSGAKVALTVGKVLVALVAVVVLAATGVSWATLQKAENGVTTDNVIDGGGTDGAGKHADGADDILLVGLDSRTDVQGNALPPQVLASLGAGEDSGEVNTDTMILLHIPDNGGPAVGISIPRDSWVNIPGYQTNKINAAYADAKATATRQLRAQGDTDSADVERKSSQAGAKELITVIQNLAGVHIDHYAEVNLYGFDQLSQAIGGVPVCLNHAVHDEKSGANFQAGYFTVQGVQALQFVRQRHGIPGGSTDLQREARQQAFLAAMAHKVLSAGTLTNPTELTNLISAIQKSIIIDSGWNLVDFAGQLAGMSSGNIKFATIPTVNIDYHPVPGSTLSAVQINPAQVAAFVKGQLGAGTTPPPSNVGSTSSPSSTNSPAGGGNSATTVDVQNGSGVHNLAAGVLAKLAKAGFGQGTTGNVGPRTSSIIYFHAGQQDAANAVASALGGKITVAQSPSVPSGHVWVYLGSHYSNEGISTAASVSGASNQGVEPAAFVPAHQADPSSISDSGDAPPCVD